jgi:hypothetical protein
MDQCSLTDTSYSEHVAFARFLRCWALDSSSAELVKAGEGANRIFFSDLTLFIL